jgi:hypothetical protein
MPDKRFSRGCGTSCLRCWRNRLKHGNKEAKAFMKAHPELEWSVDCASKKPTRRANQTAQVQDQNQAQAQTQAQAQDQTQQARKKRRRRTRNSEDYEPTPQQVAAL